MTEHATPIAIARAFTEAWTSHDMDTAAAYLADDVIFDGPLAGRITGKQAYVEGLSRFASVVTGLTIIAAFGDENQALIMYDLATARGTQTYAEQLTFRDGKIATDRLIFDTYPARAAQASQTPPPAPTE